MVFLFASRNEHDAVFIFYKPEIVIQTVIEFQTVIDMGIIVDIGCVKTSVAQRIVVAVVPFAYVESVPAFVVAASKNVGRVGLPTRI